MVAERLRIIALSMLIIAGSVHAALGEPGSAAGTWQQIDDKTGGVGALIAIREEGGVWNGYITDPSNGTDYNVTLTVSADGNQLDVHGFVGVALLGRSQVWTRLGQTKRRTRSPRP